MKTRIYFLDNLRTFLILLVIVLHASMSYQLGMDSFWVVIDPMKYKSLALVSMYIDLFVMFTMFFISGYFIPNSIKNKDTLGFMISKFKRIMIPWIIAVFTLIPAYKAIFLYSRGLPQEEWYSYFVFFQRSGSDLYFFSNNPTQSWLWFLPILFLFQILYFALAKTKVFSIKISLKTGSILTLVASIIYGLIISAKGLRGWEHSIIFDFQRERLLPYFLVFLLGSMANKLNIFVSPTKNWRYSLLSTIVLAVSVFAYSKIALNLFFNMITPGRNHFYVSEAMDGILYYVTFTLSFLLLIQFFIQIFKSLFNKRNRLMDELNQNSYQVYIIHMIVMGIIATVLMNLNISALLKFSILIISTFILSNILITGYRRIIQNFKKMKKAITVILVLSFLSVLGCQFQSNSAKETEKVQTSEPTKKLPSVDLNIAAITGNLDAIKEHIEYGSDLDKRDATSGDNPLILAAVFGKTAVAKALIEAGANVNFKKSDGGTPLHVAAFFCRPEIVKILLQNGADKSIKNKSGATALNSVEIPFESVKGIYDYLGNILAPAGLKLDYDYLKKMRPQIAEILK